ncbi:MAG: hypothetical protein VXW87_02615 [Pseudomonadota bacterium]|nr:hypothetical protein [Pseudomonadota bacterium]
MKHYIILPIVLSTSLASAFSLRDQGYFDLGFGPEQIEKTVINRVTTEYFPGPAISTSLGLAYKNGLGLALSYKFNYNKVKTEFDEDARATEFTSYIAGLNFIYKLLPSSEIAVFVQGGPGLVVNTDQMMSTTKIEQTSSVETTTDPAGNTSTKEITENDQAADPFEFRENLTFGYQLGGGIEYRQDNHKALVLQINYLKSSIFKSTYSATDPSKTISTPSDDLEAISGFLTLRYYL